MKMLILVVVGMVEIGLAVANLYEIGWAWNILKAWSIAQVIAVIISIKPLIHSKDLSPKNRAVAASIIDLSVALILAASGKIAWSVFWMFLALFSHMKRQWAKTNIEKEGSLPPNSPDQGDQSPADGTNGGGGD